MQKSFCSVLFFSVLSAIAGTASADITDFEDIIVPPGDYGVSYVPSEYHGLNWSGGYGDGSWAVSTASSAWFPSLPLPSGQNYAWSNGATDLSISSSATFNFNSMQASSGFYGNTGEAIAHGFVGANEIYTQSFTPQNTGFQLYTFNFMGIDRLTFTDQHGNLLIDDINTTNIAPVPVPPTEPIGASPVNPVLPSNDLTIDPQNPQYLFDLSIGNDGLGTSSPIFIDPIVAVGYRYQITGGKAATVVVPEVAGQTQFMLELPGYNSFAITAGIPFNLLNIDSSGFDMFSIDGINLLAGLNPTDTLAFSTGITFTAAGNIQVSMTPITAEAVPEPNIFGLFGITGLMWFIARRRCFLV